MLGCTRLLAVSTAKRNAYLTPALISKRMLTQQAFGYRPRYSQVTQLTLGGIRQHGTHGHHHHHDADLVASLKTSGKTRENPTRKLYIDSFDRQARYAYHCHRPGFQRWVDYHKRCSWMVFSTRYGSVSVTKCL
jgi:hypothetical protein